jgi:hypothetical protein
VVRGAETMTTRELIERYEARLAAHHAAIAALWGAETELCRDLDRLGPAILGGKVYVLTTPGRLVKVAAPADPSRDGPDVRRLD